MSEEQEVTLETEHLEEVIEAPPTGQPVVVIQYRSRGVPWYLVLPLLVLIPLGSVAVYHRVTSRARRALAAVPVQAPGFPRSRRHDGRPAVEVGRRERLVAPPVPDHRFRPGQPAARPEFAADRPRCACSCSRERGRTETSRSHRRGVRAC